jgi:hypothetical protein
MSAYDVREAIAERLIPKENAIDRYRYVYGGFDDVLLKHIANRETPQAASEHGSPG